MGKDANAVGYHLATQADLDGYAQKRQQLGQMQAPLLLDTNNPHQRLYIAAMDGTENSIYQDAPAEWSAVGKLHAQPALPCPNNSLPAKQGGALCRMKPAA